MTFATGPMVYIMIWVVILFMVLPWGVSIPEKVEKGHATSAPSNPHMGIKLLVTSVLSFLIWIVAYLVLQH
jgi:predicted secreted protein